MNKDEVLALMASSRNETEWNENCDIVKAITRSEEGKDYPAWWFLEVVASGLMSRVQKNWTKQ